MLTTVEVYDALGRMSKRLHMGYTQGSPYIIKKIEGLGPVAASIVTTSYSAQDGETYQSAKAGMRNVVLTLGYRANYAVGDSIQKVRRDLYASLPPKADIKLRFIDDEGVTVDINGYVETHEPAIFSEEPEVVISILCPQPYFRGLKAVVLDGYTNTAIDTNYVGDALTGFFLELFVDREISMVTVKNNLDRDIVFNGGLYNGDKLAISTVKGEKSIRRTRTSDTVSVLGGLISGSLSMDIGPLIEYIRVTVPNSVQIPLTITYTPMYVGL